MWMNVFLLIAVIPMQLATTLKGITPAFATLDTQAMAFLVQVRACILPSLHSKMHEADLYIAVNQIISQRKQGHRITGL